MISNLQQLIDTIQAGEASVAGLAGSGTAYVLSGYQRHDPVPLLLVVTSTSKDMMEMARELEFYGAADGVFRFPPYDTLPYFQISPHRDVQAQRMQTLTALLHDPRPKCVVAPIAALASPVIAPSRLQEQRQILRPGDLSDRDILASLLYDWGYQKAPLVEDRGTFAVRGGLIDLWGPLDSHPWRVEFFGDTIESIRRFDPYSQKSADQLDEAWLVPVKELLWDEATRHELAAAFVERADQVGLKATEKRDTAERMRSGLWFGGVEHLLPLLKPAASLFDYVPAGTRLILNHPADIATHFEELQEEIARGHAQTQSIERTVAAEEHLLSGVLETETLQSYACLRLHPYDDEGKQVVKMETNEDLRWHIRRKVEAPLAELATQLKQWQQDHRVMLVASSATQRRRILDLFGPYGLDIVSWDRDVASTIQNSPGKVPVLLGDVSRGFRWPDERLIIITDEEIFGPKARRTPKGLSSQERFLSFGTLQDGDALVHEEHGIGLYRGVKRLKIGDLDGDFLLLEYANKDKLYVPSYRMNQVQPYTGGGKATRLDRLGGTSWLKVREKAQKAIRQMAGEILNLYATRAAGQGHAFTDGSEIFEAFEASFPYEETEDQARTIGEVLEDMERPVPMDRLVLGDVGYGKTEVAMRAAFKAVLHNKQAAILVPTTVLGFQHYRNFCERFKEYPLQIGILSRFQTRQEIKQTLEEIKNGRVDIVIGTHRLLQPDVSFKDLGLLVIDEEHRFGVMQKEKIKQFKKSIDVLALSATPIPRTLNMAMTGLRGISVIETPPTDRLAIRTYVTPYNDETVREAVMREIRRGGQVFYVHNRVQDIGRVQDRLQRILPDIRIGLAHGQMKEAELEQAMIDFSNRQYDVLLCTTIIESGIDIPTANTILIERADELGLAQVYQLRGRVGRGSQRAYAYLLHAHRKAVTPEAQKRLAVLQRFSELGSGFKMASHDLEIRGAGNLLGEKQAGHVAAIGFDLYSDLLQQTIKELQGEVVLEGIEPELHLQVSASIPEDYVPDPALRLDLYRRLAALEQEEDAYSLEEEIADRFGPLPEDTIQLIQLMMVKALAKQLRLRAIHYNRDQFVYSFDASTPLAPDVILSHLGEDPKKYRLTPEMKLIVSDEAKDVAQRLKKARAFLRDLIGQV